MSKNEKKKKCVEDGDLKRCIVFHRKIEVWLDGRIEVTGIIEKFTENSVKANGDYYFRSSCTFYMV